MGGGGRAGGWSRCSHGRLEGWQVVLEMLGFEKSRLFVRACVCGGGEMRNLRPALAPRDGWVTLVPLGARARAATHVHCPDQPPAVPEKTERHFD